MSTDLKTSLFPMLNEQRAAYGLWDLTYPSFIRKSGWRVDLSASDCVEALGAMLEAATGVRLDFSSATDGRRALVGGEGGIAGGVGQHSAATQHGGREEWAQGMRSWVAKGAPGGVEGDKENLNPDGTVKDKDDEGMTDKEKRARRDRDESEARRQNFWYAWDALDPEEYVSPSSPPLSHAPLPSLALEGSPTRSLSAEDSQADALGPPPLRSTSLLRKALPLSMALHRAVITQGSFLFDKQTIRMFRSYRLAVLKEGPDLAVFQHPATLLRLAHWLVDAIRALLEHHTAAGAGGGGASGAAKNLPLVLAALNEQSDKFLVVGVVPADEFGDVRRNRFGRAFEEAAIRSRAKAQQRYFDASVVEVRRDDFDKFLVRQLSLSRSQSSRAPLADECLHRRSQKDLSMG